MKDNLAWLTIPRKKPSYRPVQERLRDFRDVTVLREEAEACTQASRCNDCFSSFCHWACPVGNYIPDFNHYLAQGQWDEAFWVLQSHNNFPEFTGRLCPALCEASCVLLGAGGDAVTNRENELAIVEHAFRCGLVRPQPPHHRTDASVAVIGSGPAGLACADQLNKRGHRVVVFERDRQPGGILRYGIPDFKLEKWVIDRRVNILKEEGIEVRTSLSVGDAYPASRLLEEFDAVCLAIGSRRPRDLPIDGRSLRGIHMAMDYLAQANRRIAGEPIEGTPITASGKDVVVLGGGDTGADCVGTALRQEARSVVQLELLPKPPETRGPNDLWPDWPNLLRTSTSHEEGGRREWATQTKRFLGRGGHVKQLECVRVAWSTASGQRKTCEEMPGTGCTLKADLVILAMGFVGSGDQGLLETLGVRRNGRQHIEADAQYRTSAPNIFTAGDAHRGPSLVTWAIAEGRSAAECIDRSLTAARSLSVTS